MEEQEQEFLLVWWGVFSVWRERGFGPLVDRERAAAAAARESLCLIETAGGVGVAASVAFRGLEYVRADGGSLFTPVRPTKDAIARLREFLHTNNWRGRAVCELHVAIGKQPRLYQ